MTPMERAEKALFGKDRGTHYGDDERDLYAISRATLARTIEEAERDILRVAQHPRDPAVDPIELRNNTIEVCAKIAERSALRCVREQIPGDSVARFVAQQIRGLREALAVPSTPRRSPGGLTDSEKLERAAALAQACCTTCNGRGYVVRDSAIDGPYTVDCPACPLSSTDKSGAA